MITLLPNKNMVHRPVIFSGNGQAIESSQITLFLPNIKMAAGDLLLLHAISRTSAVTPNIPSGWSNLAWDLDAGSFWSQRLMYKICAGTEAPLDPVTVLFTPVTSSILCGNIYLIKNQASAFNEAATVDNNNNGTLSHNSMTSTVPGALALAFYSWVGNGQDTAMTGATGGAWVRPTGNYGIFNGTGSLHCHGNMQYAKLDSAKTISGGSSSLTGLSICRSLIIKTSL